MALSRRHPRSLPPNDARGIRGPSRLGGPGPERSLASGAGVARWVGNSDRPLLVRAGPPLHVLDGLSRAEGGRSRGRNRQSDVVSMVSVSNQRRRRRRMRTRTLAAAFLALGLVGGV